MLSGGTLNINIMATYVSASGYIILYRAVAREDPKALAAEVSHCKQMDNLQKAIIDYEGLYNYKRIEWTFYLNEM